MKRAHHDSDTYRKHDLVDVFFRFGHTMSHDFFPCPSEEALLRPRLAVTDGWMPAQVVEESIESRVLVAMDGKWMDRVGQLASQTHNMWFEQRDVRRRPALQPVPPPALSLLLVRWGGEAGATHEDEHCGAITSSVTAGYIGSFLSMLYECVGPNYQCVSAFVENSGDLTRLDPASVARQLGGKQRAALYFLWPSRFRDGVATRYQPDGQALKFGMVNADALLRCMHGLEAAGICTRFPHPSQLYAVLLAKEYQASLCTCPSFALPPATLVNRGLALLDPMRAASSAMAALARLRAPGVAAPGIGVVKLGYSWEAVHVRTFTSQEELAAVLTLFSSKEGCEAPCLLVADFVTNTFEMRVYVVRGRMLHAAYTNFDWEGCGYLGKPYDFEQKTRAEVVAEWLDGDEDAMRMAEAHAAELVAHWERWLCACSSEPVPALRMDFLVHHTARGHASVHSLELTELGFCMLGWRGGPRAVMSAIVESCLEGSPPEGAAAIQAFVEAVTATADTQTVIPR